MDSMPAYVARFQVPQCPRSRLTWYSSTLAGHLGVPRVLQCSDMGTITAIEPQQRDSERVSVFIDGRFAFGTSKLLALNAGLSVGKELLAAEVADLSTDDTVDRAFNQALDFLSYRPRSRDEVLRYLRKRGVEAAVADRVLERLQETQLVSDSQFAAFWVQNRQQFSPRGSWALRHELRQKGVDAEAIDQALVDLPPEDAMAYDAGRRRLHTYARYAEADFLRKMTAFLQRRGFGYGPAQRAATRLWQESAGERADLTDTAKDEPWERDDQTGS